MLKLTDSFFFVFFLLECSSERSGEGGFGTLIFRLPDTTYFFVFGFFLFFFSLSAAQDSTSSISNPLSTFEIYLSTNAEYFLEQNIQNIADFKGFNSSNFPTHFHMPRLATEIFLPTFLLFGLNVEQLEFLLPTKYHTLTQHVGIFENTHIFLKEQFSMNTIWGFASIYRKNRN